MSVEHVDIDDPNIHEPKGVSTANADTVYIADGAGSGEWASLTLETIDTSSIFGTNSFWLWANLENIGTAGEVFLPVTRGCNVITATLVLGGAITGSDETITFRRSDGASMGTVTVTQSGSATGDTYTFTPSANEELVADQYLEIETAGNCTGTVSMFITVEFELTE